MRQPYTPRPNEPIKAEHLRSHSEAIMWLFGQLKNRPRPMAGGGGGAAAPPAPLTIVSSRPSYIPEPETPVAEGYSRYYQTWGLINGVMGDEWNGYLDIPTNVAGRTYFVMKVYLEPITGSPVPPEVTVSNWELVTFTQDQITAGDAQTPAYSPTGDRPSHMFVFVGSVLVADGPTPESPLTVSLLNSAAGSVDIIEYVMGIDFQNDGGTTYQKGLKAERLQAP